MISAAELMTESCISPQKISTDAAVLRAASITSHHKTPMTYITDQTRLVASSSFAAGMNLDWHYRGFIPKSYPLPPKDGGVTETIHGIRVEDPWRSLEDLTTDSTKDFMRRQNEVSTQISLLG
jgi:hypothetical protein